MSYQSKHTLETRKIAHEIEDLQRKIRYYNSRIELCSKRILTKKQQLNIVV